MEFDRTNLKPTHLAILDELQAAVAELSEAFTSGNDRGVSSIIGRIRGLEAQILEIQKEANDHDVEFKSLADAIETTVNERKSRN